MRMILAIVPSAIPALLLCATTVAALAGNTALTPVSDRYGEDADSDGIFETLYEETTTQLYADSNYFGLGDRSAAMEFELLSIPATAVVQSAVFSLKAVNLTLYNSEHLHGYSGNGSVELGDMTGGALLGAFTVPGSSAIGELEIGAFIQELVSSGQTYAGIRVQSGGCGVYSSCGVSFHASGTAQPPTLIVQFAVPPRITSIGPTNALDLDVVFESHSGQTYFLERSTNLGDWTVSQTNIVGTGVPVHVTDVGGLSFDAAYYRVGVEQ